jgi:hypothetical protein
VPVAQLNNNLPKSFALMRNHWTETSLNLEARMRKQAYHPIDDHAPFHAH